MLFVMPESYDLLSLISPLRADKNRACDSMISAVIRFSGFAGPGKDEKNLRILDQTLQEHGIKTEGKNCK